MLFSSAQGLLARYTMFENMKAYPGYFVTAVCVVGFTVCCFLFFLDQKIEAESRSSTLTSTTKAPEVIGPAPSELKSAVDPVDADTLFQVQQEEETPLAALLEPPLETPSKTPAASLPNVVQEVEAGTRKTHSILARASALPGKIAQGKQAFEIPEGWRLEQAEITKRKGRARILEEDGYVILEVHAMSREKHQQVQAFAVANISVIKE